MGVKGKTLGEFFNHDFEKGCFRLCDSRGHVAYSENSDKNWYRYERDSEGRVVYYEDSNEYWYRYEYDSEGNETYYESSYGTIGGVSREVVEMTMEEVEKLAGKKVKIVKTK